MLPPFLTEGADGEAILRLMHQVHCLRHNLKPFGAFGHVKAIRCSLQTSPSTPLQETLDGRVVHTKQLPWSPRTRAAH